jgi:hypothetical protein
MQQDMIKSMNKGMERANYVMDYARTINKTIIRSHLVEKGKHVALPAGFKPVPVPPKIAVQLASFTLDEKYMILSHAPEITKVTTVTTFNVDIAMQALGYHMEVPSGEIDFNEHGDTLMTGIDGTEFPMKNSRGYVKFTNNVGRFFYCPIDTIYINTNFFRNSQIDKPYYNAQVTEAVALIATFYSMRNGEIVKMFSATEAGKQLLNYDTILSRAYETSLEYVNSVIQGWLQQVPCTHARGWKQTTAHGLDFAHLLYVLASKIGPNAIPIISIITNMIVDQMTRKGKTLRFFEVNMDSMVINGVGLSLPTFLLGVKMNIRNKEAELNQAYTALMMARSVRGVDKSAKGSFSRKSYLEVSMDAGVAEILYMAQNISWMKTPNIFVQTDYGKTSGTVVKLLTALVLNDFDGVVFLDTNSPLRNTMTITSEKFKLVIPDAPESAEPQFYADVLYKYTVGKYRVVFAPIVPLINVYSHIRQDGSKYRGIVPDAGVVFDLREMSNVSYERKKFGSMDASYEDATYIRVQSYSSYMYPVVFRVPAHEKMFSDGYSDVQCVTGVEIHNLVFWGLYKCLFIVPDNIYVCAPETRQEICAASILANIGRCMFVLLRASVTSLLTFYKFKVPKINLAGISRLVTAQIAYSDEEFLSAMSKGSAEVLRYFSQGNFVEQTMALATLAGDAIRDDNVHDSGHDGEGSSQLVVPMKIAFGNVEDEDDGYMDMNLTSLNDK